MSQEKLYIEGIEMFFHNSLRTPNHCHEWMELSYVVSGKGIHIINGVETTIEKGDYFFINPNSFHQELLENDGNEEASMISCIFFPEFIDPMLSNCKSLSNLLFNFHVFVDLKNKKNDVNPVADPLSTYFHDQDGTVKQLFLQGYDEYIGHEIGFEEIIRNNIINILIILLRKNKLLSNNVPNEPFSIIYKYMCDNYMKEVTLDVVSKLVGYSPQYISMHFAEKTNGDNFKRTLKKIRISNACRLLISTNKSVSEIIGLVGYRDSKTFYEAFKDITNTSPYQYKKIAQSPPSPHHRKN